MAIAATPVSWATTDFRTVSPATAAKWALWASAAAQLGNVNVQLTTPEKLAINAVPATTNIRNVYRVNATVTDLMESPATTKANVSVITTSQDNGAMVAKKAFTIFPNAKTVIVIQRVLWLGLRAVGQYLRENFASARKGWKVAFVINVALCIGISTSTIRKGVKSVTVTYLGYLVVLRFAIQTVESVFVSLLW